MFISKIVVHLHYKIKTKTMKTKEDLRIQCTNLIRRTENSILDLQTMQSGIILSPELFRSLLNESEETFIRLGQLQQRRFRLIRKLCNL